MPHSSDVDQQITEEYYSDIPGVVTKATDPDNNAPKWLNDYILDLRDHMGLRDWSLYIRVEDLGDKAGQCIATYGRRLATIKLDAGSVQGSLAELRSTIVHELLHCHYAPVVWAFNGVGKQVLPPVFTALQDAFIDAEELAVDNIAMAWAMSFPLPKRPSENVDKPKAKQKRKKAA